jgi:hypothetical protein
VTVIVPAVGSAHVGSVEDAATIGATGAGFTVTFGPAQFPELMLVIVIVYVPAGTPLNIGEL